MTSPRASTSGRLPPSPPSAERPSGRSAPFLPAAALLAVTFTAYATSLGNGFVWDDHRVVESAESGSATLQTVLTAPDVLWRSDPAAYWRPLARATYLLDRRLFGLHPLPYHLENVLLQALAAMSLFAVGRRLLGGTGPALAAAVLFAVHPVSAEAVNFVTARNNLLVAVFVLNSWLVTLRARDERRPWLLLPAAALFFLGLLCKETAFMLLPFLAAQEIVAPREHRGSLRERFASLLPHAGAAATYLVLRASVLPSLVAARPTLDGLGAALARDLHIVPEYLALLLFPSGLTVHHAEPEAYFAGAPALVAAWAGIAIALGLLLRGGRPATRLGLLWFAVQFVPVSTIIPMPSAPIAERHLYLPAIGLWLVAADQLARLADALRRPRAVAWGVAAVAVALTAVTARRNLDWKDDVSLFSSALRVHPASSEARFDYALALADRGDVEGARREWERIVALDPRHVGALSQLGTYFAERGRLDEAAAYFSRVLAVDPRDVETRFNMALLLERLHRPREALEEYERFLALDPVDFPDLVPRVRERVRRLREALGEPAR